RSPDRGTTARRLLMLGRPRRRRRWHMLLRLPVHWRLIRRLGNEPEGAGRHPGRSQEGNGENGMFFPPLVGYPVRPFLGEWGSHVAERPNDHLRGILAAAHEERGDQAEDHDQTSRPRVHSYPRRDPNGWKGGAIPG